eukprot:7542-Eustigmatos_ZCMA.PRE.1
MARLRGCHAIKGPAPGAGGRIEAASGVAEGHEHVQKERAVLAGPASQDGGGRQARSCPQQRLLL